jgi:hypothetical protein
LPEIIATRHLSGGFTHALNRRQGESGDDADHCNYNQQFD